MIILYDKRNIGSLLSSTYYIHDVEKVFSLKSVSTPALQKDGAKEILKVIDGVTVKKGSYVKTKFGECSINDLSTGCKALLLANYFGENNIVNFSECGDNVIDYASTMKRRIKAYIPQILTLNNNRVVEYNNKIVKVGDL